MDDASETIRRSTSFQRRPYLLMRMAAHGGAPHGRIARHAPLATPLSHVLCTSVYLPVVLLVLKLKSAPLQIQTR
jgi:hypothetical protein